MAAESNKSLAERIAIMEQSLMNITKDFGLFSNDMSEINSWIHNHELEHKDISHSLKSIVVLLEQEKLERKADREKAESEKKALTVATEKKKGNFVNVIKNAKEVLTFVVLVLGIISAASLWMYNTARDIENITDHVDVERQAGQKK